MRDSAVCGGLCRFDFYRGEGDGSSSCGTRIWKGWRSASGYLHGCMLTHKTVFCSHYGYCSNAGVVKVPPPIGADPRGDRLFFSEPHELDPSPPSIFWKRGSRGLSLPCPCDKRRSITVLHTNHTNRRWGVNTGKNHPIRPFLAKPPTLPPLKTTVGVRVVVARSVGP